VVFVGCLYGLGLGFQAEEAGLVAFVIRDRTM